MIVAFFLPSVSVLMGVVINHLSDWLIWIVKLFAGLNISEMLTGKTNVAVILLFYVLVIFAFFFPPAPQPQKISSAQHQPSYSSSRWRCPGGKGHTGIT